MYALEEALGTRRSHVENLSILQHSHSFGSDEYKASALKKNDLVKDNISLSISRMICRQFEGDLALNLEQLSGGQDNAGFDIFISCHCTFKVSRPVKPPLSTKTKDTAAKGSLANGLSKLMKQQSPAAEPADNNIEIDLEVDDMKLKKQVENARESFRADNEEKSLLSQLCDEQALESGRLKYPEKLDSNCLDAIFTDNNKRDGNAG